ncbi:MAG: MraY family glycosyltransferase, partial [Planctomycetota bacterium]
MTWPVLGLLLVGFAIACPATATLIRLGHRLRALDSAGATGHAKALRPVPNIGGFAIYLAVAGPMLVGMLALLTIGAETWQRLVPAIVPHLERAGATAPTTLVLLAGMTALHVIGVIDDRRGLPAWPKLLVQVVAATVIVVWFDVRLLTALGAVPSVIVTIFWIVAITNAINFLDNMDGLAAGVAAVAGGLFMVATIVNNQWFIAATLALLVGALAGFLLFNFPPAKIFMGDGGSLVIGFLLAVLTARTTYYDPTQEAFPLGSAWYGVFMPVVVLAIPLYDLCTVTALRLRQGRSPFVGDQQHFSHRLVRRGLSPRGAVVVIWAATLVTGIGGVGLGRLEGWQAILVGAQ